MKSFPTLSLEALLHLRWAAKPWDADVVGRAVDGQRTRESFLRHWLPEWLIRRMDRGFARSNPVHPDTARALYCIARAARPEWVYETGTYWGYSTAYLAAALADLGRGKVISIDLYAKAGSHIPKALLPWVELHRGLPATEVLPRLLAERQPQIFFQDSVHDYDGVRQELLTVLPHLSADATVLLHDFVAEGVWQAARDSLPGFEIFQLESGDPQQLGVAFRRAAGR